MDSFITPEFIISYYKFGFWCAIFLIPIMIIGPIIYIIMINISNKQKRIKYGWELPCQKEKDQKN